MSFYPPSEPPPPSPLNLPFSHPLDLQRFHKRGWMPVDLSKVTTSNGNNLQDDFLALFELSKQFFQLPLSDKQKYDYSSTEGSEHGWSRVVGEKELLTIRTIDSTPPVPSDLRTLVDRAWRGFGEIIRMSVREIENSIGWNRGTLERLVTDCLLLPKGRDEKVATIMRMFRYERHTTEHQNLSPTGDKLPPGVRVVGYPHGDLGILSIVIGSSPGLQAYDPYRPAGDEWISIEEPYFLPFIPKLPCTIMVGQILSTLTNNAYKPGIHAVVVPPDLGEEPYRFSLVYACRPHYPVMVNTRDMETEVTGKWKEKNKMEGKTMEEVWKDVASKKLNVNLQTHRERLEELVEESRKSEDSKGSIANGKGMG